MNCKEFQHWLTTRDSLLEEENPKIMDHIAICNHCKKLFKADESLETMIQSHFHMESMPKGLADQVDISINHVDLPFKQKNRWLPYVAASVVLFVIAISFAIYNQPFKYQNLQQLSESAVTRHLKKDTSMTFTAEQIELAKVSLNKELNFNVILPNLHPQGYVLLGGRLCVLEKCKIAYLFYKKDEKLCSLFIMDYSNLDFAMADGSRFNNEIKGCNTDIWKDKGQVYAMVY